MTETQNDKASVQIGARRAARLAAVQMLYQIEYGQERRDGMHLDDGEAGTEPDKPLLAGIVKTAAERRADIDGILAQSLDAAWPLERLERVLCAVLRAGVAELLMPGAGQTAIIINDYVDVAHAFFAGKEPGLVNAVLDKAAKTLRAA